MEALRKHEDGFRSAIATDTLALMAPSVTDNFDKLEFMIKLPSYTTALCLRIQL